ncbi:uncharacterized protein LOC111131205 isoform X1 [Crassostrea virginica]
MLRKFGSAEEFWQAQASFEAIKNRQLRYQHGQGVCNIFILDTSSSLGEDGFKEMKETFISIIDEYAKYPAMDENVAVIVCGKTVRFQRYYSNHYEDIKHCLDEVEFGGPSPLTAAFFLSVGAITNGASHTRVMNEFKIHPRLILISDGRPTSITDDFSITDDSGQMEREEDKHLLLQFTSQLGKLHPFFCIPVGRRPDLTLLNFLCSQSGGKIVYPYEARQFAKYSRNTKVAAMLFSKRRTESTDKERILMTLASEFPQWEFSDKDQDDIYEIYSKRPMLCSMDERKFEKHSFEERDPQMPTLGTRVRRGPDWMWKEQDNYGPGTVIAHSNEDGWLFVEWDTGNYNAYRYGPVLNKYDVKCCNEPRILCNESIATGCLVTRGPDWEWDDQDGGMGKIGCVLNVQGSGIVLVRWQHGFISQYRFGSNGKFDLEICDPFLPEAIKYIEDKMQNVAHAVFSSNDTQPFLQEDLENTCSPVKYEKLEKKTENVWKPRHVLHVTKGKYFKNKEVDMSSSDIETDRLNISYAKKQWFWKDGEGKWNPYSRETNARINKCHQRDPKSTVVVSVNNTSYRIVMAKNIQINLATREISEIKLVEDASNS